MAQGKTASAGMMLYTIGHSNHSLEQFASLLELFGIQVVVDVRSAPYSKYVSHFNKEMLESGLKRRSIIFVYEGKDLGGRPKDSSCYKKPQVSSTREGDKSFPEVTKSKELISSSINSTGKVADHLSQDGEPPEPNNKPAESKDKKIDYIHEVDYPAVMEKPWFEKAIERVLKLAEDKIVAVMCSEEDPANCHRHHLIAKYLLEWYPDVKVIHIRGDGQSYGAASITKSVNEEPGEQLSLFDNL